MNNTLNNEENEMDEYADDYFRELDVLFGTRWIVTREIPRERNGPEMIAICRNEDLAILVIRSRDDYNRYGVEYDCIEVDNYG